MSAMFLAMVWHAQRRQMALAEVRGVAEMRVEPELDFGLDVGEGDLLFAERHLLALVERDLVVVAPLVDAHLLADQRR